MNQSLTQLTQQLHDIWRQLGLNQRISVVFGTGIVVAGLLGLMLWSSRPDYALLYGKLDEAEAAKVIAALDDAKIPYKISRGGGTISVPADKVHVMRMQLAAKGIPRGEGVGFEIFDKPNFGISDFVQRANYLRAVQGELARTIGQLEGVEAARVMIVIPENRLLIDNQKKPTASVFVRLRGQGPLAPTAVNSIQFLVANAVEGLQAQNVSVVDNHGNSLSDNDARDSIAGLSGTQLNAQRNLEQYLSKKAEGMLDKVLGPGQSVVRVAAEINFDSLTRTEEKYDPDGQVIRNSTVTDETNDATTGSGSGGSPGVAANAPSETNSVSGAAVNNTKMKKKQTTSTYEINRSTSQIMQAAGGLKRVSAAVFIATKTEGTGTARKPVARPKEELDKLRRIVQSALGIQAGEESTRQDEITLEEIPFNDEPLLEVTQQLGKQERTQFWWDKAQESVYALIALAALFFFWRMLKKAPAEEIPIGIPLRKFAHAGNGNGNGHVNGHHDSHGNSGNLLSDWQKSPTPPAVTVEVLNQLLKENPNNLTQAIRTWMTRGQTKK